MGRILFVGLAALGMVWLAVGCASKNQVIALQEDHKVLEAKLDSLRAPNPQIMAAIGAQDATIRELRANMDYKFTQLDERIQAMASTIGESDSRFASLIAAMDEINMRAAANDTLADAPGKEIFDAAQADLTRGNYELAQEGFIQFLRRHPASSLADDAQYGLAECYYGRQKFTEAISEYERVLLLYPDGDKAPAALLRLGLAYQNLENPAKTKEQWEKLIGLYPDSPEAAIAKERLKSLPKL